MFKKVATLLLFSVFSLWLNGADFEVTKGWNLLGTTEKISDLSSFKYQGVNIIWVFDKINKKWKVYAPEYNGTLTFDTIDEIPAKSGFWVYSKNDSNIKVNSIYQNCTQFFNEHNDINSSFVTINIDNYTTNVLCEKTDDGVISGIYTLTKEFGFEYNGKKINAKYKIFENNVTNFEFICPLNQTPQFMDESVWWQGGWCSGEDRKNRVMCRDSKIFDDCYCCDENTSIYGHSKTIIYDYAKVKIKE